VSETNLYGGKTRASMHVAPTAQPLLCMGFVDAKTSFNRGQCLEVKGGHDGVKTKIQLGLGS